MKSLFFDTKVKTDEDYERYLKRKMPLFYFLIFIGVFTISVIFLAKYVWEMNLKEWILSFYSGVGVGLIFGGILATVKFKLILKNRSKLREERIKYSDERNQKISIQAGKISLVALILSLYIVMIIGGLFNHEIIRLMIGILAIFFMAYGISYKILEKKL